MSSLNYYECPLDARYMMRSLCEYKRGNRLKHMHPILDALRIFNRLEKQKIYIPVDTKSFRQSARELCDARGIKDIPSRLKAAEGEFVNGQLQLILENIMSRIENEHTTRDKPGNDFYDKEGPKNYRLDVSREEKYNGDSRDTYDVLLSIERNGVADFRIWIESDSSRADELALKTLKLRHIINTAKPSDFFVSWLYFTTAQIRRNNSPKIPAVEFKKHAKKLFSLSRKINLPISLAVFVCKQDTSELKRMDLEIKQSRNGTYCLWPIPPCSGGT